MRFRGIPGPQGHFTALNRALEHAFEIMDHVWCDTATVATAVDFTSPATLAVVQVPAPPDGYAVLVEGWCNLEWANATALDAYVNIQYGNRTLACNRLLTEATALGVSCATKAVFNTDHTTTLRLVVKDNGGRTSATVNARGIVARYIMKR